MYQAQAALFLYAISPVHMGAGTAFGLIDSPIQRERHTEHPLFAGSGLKGAVRHRFGQLTEWKNDTLLNRLFGPEGQSDNLHAGAVSFGDAQLVAFPVRCAKQGYVYITSPLTLARAARLLALLGKKDFPALPAAPAEGEASITAVDLLSGDKLHLEAFEYRAQQNAPLQAVAQWLAANALPQAAAHEFFRSKLSQHLVLLPDDDFGYFVRNATVVEPHVRIDDEKGTAADGGLFYVENLPPESLLIAPLMASQERSGKAEKLEAEAVLSQVSAGLDGQMVQIGGDASTGRGQVLVTVLK